MHLVSAAISTRFSAPVSEKNIEIDTSEHDKCWDHCSRVLCSVGKDADSQSDGEFKRASWPLSNLKTIKSDKSSDIPRSCSNFTV